MSRKKISDPDAALGGAVAPTAPDGGAPKTSVGDTIKTIAWSFFGIRKRHDHDSEAPRINPIHIVLAGFVGVFLLVVGLMVLVNIVVAK